MSYITLLHTNHFQHVAMRCRFTDWVETVRVRDTDYLTPGCRLDDEPTPHAAQEAAHLLSLNRALVSGEGGDFQGHLVHMPPRPSELVATQSEVYKTDPSVEKPLLIAVPFLIPVAVAGACADRSVPRRVPVGVDEVEAGVRPWAAHGDIREDHSGAVGACLAYAQIPAQFAPLSRRTTWSSSPGATNMKYGHSEA